MKEEPDPDVGRKVYGAPLPEDGPSAVDGEPSHGETKTPKMSRREAIMRFRLEIAKHVAGPLATKDQLDPDAIAEKSLKVADSLLLRTGFLGTKKQRREGHLPPNAVVRHGEVSNIDGDDEIDYG